MNLKMMPAFANFAVNFYIHPSQKILESLKPGMTTPEVVLFPDSHFRRVIYGLGPYIADYPEQALLACIVQGWCPKYVFFYTDLMLTNKSFQMYCPCQRPRRQSAFAPLSGTYRTTS
jgi:hypothetical protein